MAWRHMQVYMAAHKMKPIVGFNSASIVTFIKMAVILADEWTYISAKQTNRISMCGR